ncbi:uncharacterized protein BO88DRAFT_458502 [Aspergillus vadensis CBS 113365]|uniref:Uncharacterized protein n=1 Tax=Aspergillus vadensis (strain CBS 113365 / IMI 142717 / IBT 24658) TaxID=1448311 RepID=A0A319AUI5_ASPVC|nr:hypothetical protein BO88DRAFT_458502 [Aspergillus vadensis CBS 113365]PYH64007.1 hypothetical protein BO88DRAFT_458502 [Aspergillus vadensis CBS 113365]
MGSGNVIEPNVGFSACSQGPWLSFNSPSMLSLRLLRTQILHAFPPETKTLLLSLAKTTLGLIPTIPFDNVIDGVDHEDSNALEQQLEAVFKIDKHFDAMLRLDEIATFMEQLNLTTILKVPL